MRITSNALIDLRIPFLVMPNTTLYITHIAHTSKTTLTTLAYIIMLHILITDLRLNTLTTARVGPQHIPYIPSKPTSVHVYLHT